MKKLAMALAILSVTTIELCAQRAGTPGSRTRTRESSRYDRPAILQKRSDFSPINYEEAEEISIVDIPKMWEDQRSIPYEGTRHKTTEDLRERQSRQQSAGGIIRRNR